MRSVTLLSRAKSGLVFEHEASRSGEKDESSDGGKANHGNKGQNSFGRNGTYWNWGALTLIVSSECCVDA